MIGSQKFLNKSVLASNACFRSYGRTSNISANEAFLFVRKLCLRLSSTVNKTVMSDALDLLLFFASKDFCGPAVVAFEAVGVFEKDAKAAFVE